MFQLTPAEIEAIGLSLKVATASVVCSLPFGLLVAWLLARKSFIGKGLLSALVHIPLVVPPVVVGYLMLILLGRQGFVGKWLYDSFDITFVFDWKGAVVAAAVVSFPLMVRAIQLSLETVDPLLEEAAGTLGAKPAQVFWTITMPIVLPGVITGMTLAFARALGEFGATITFASNIPGETRTLPLALYTATQTPGGDSIAMRLVVISVLLAGIALLVSEFLARRAHMRIRRGYPT